MHATVWYLLVAGMSIVLLVDGTPTARVIGAVLLATCLLLAGRLARRHFVKASE